MVHIHAMATQARVASSGWRTFGEESHRGDDFEQTDIVPALA